ncbi:MAG: serine/threonine protein phosphatase [Proteobacteria bacterium]|nr:serine/threonine protein phosphatase [Cystobacterineae bacterium]MCL2259284.1 serine/threonine protein phosphatase [Cystobacterineae bacterium]MCL2314316.1 serine/threonine protein phosphatase [Pseudomonadota bacterium]
MHTLVVGDIHGCLQEFDDLLRLSGLRQGEPLVLVGDMVAKGPDSVGVLRRMREWKAKAVRGNHDFHLLRYRREPQRFPKLKALAHTFGEEDWQLLESLPLWLPVDDKHVAVHAGFVPGLALEKQNPETMMTLRSMDSAGNPTSTLNGTPWAKLWQGPPHVFFGHDARRQLQRYPWATGLDTGCVYGGALSGCLLPEHILLQVPARQRWAPTEDEAPPLGG